MAYYACYNSLYAILMKCGIYSEIHDCTIGLMLFLGFDPEDVKFIMRLKHNRIDIQYYLKNHALESEEKVKRFVIRCRTINDSLTSLQIESIRKTIEGRMKEKKKIK